MEEIFYTYLIYSQSRNKYYIGKTNNIARRFKEHNNGEEKYTKTGSPWTLIGAILSQTNSEATKRENKLKRAKNTKYIKWYFEQHKI